ncbi:hypothetical protein [Pseudopedobacter beijingensis]|uniref:Uncharacterized protein n=1 Tax=Pseudopedobacter beijingensis TaxID=1207056 RepID=A0ABW4IAC6_9SPHI
MNFYNHERQKISISNDSDADYEKAELDLLRKALKRSYTERFLIMTRLMRMDMMFRKAKVTHKTISYSDEI